MDDTREQKTREECTKISERKELIRKGSPPKIGTNDGSKYMEYEREKWTKNPFPKREVSMNEIENIFNKNKPKSYKKRKEDNILFGKLEIPSYESDARKMLGGFFKNGRK